MTNWEDERYVRLYTRDNPEWLCLSFLAQGLFCLLLRKVDRAGVLQLGKVGKRGVAVAVGHAHQWSQLEPALDELLADGCVKIQGGHLVIPNFIEAQEAHASDKARSRKHREKRRDGVTGKEQAVADRHDDAPQCDGDDTKRGEGVTGRDQTVTPSPAQPIRAVPIRSVPSGHNGEARAGERVKFGPLGSELRGLVEEAMGAPIGPCSQEKADRLEPLIESAGGVRAAFDFLAWKSRKAKVRPESMGLLFDFLTDATPSATQGGA